MKAIVCTKYGPPTVLQAEEVEKPTPKDDQVLIRVRATTVTSGDVRLRKADPFLIRLFFGLLKPRKPILGSDFAGEVEAVGKEVRRFKPGDKVFDYTKEDFAAAGPYDLVYHTVGKISFSKGLRSLKKGGAYVSALLLAPLLRRPWAAIGGRKKVVGGIAKVKAEDMEFLKELVEAGKLIAVIDRQYPLEKIAEAHGFAERRRGVLSGRSDHLKFAVVPHDDFPRAIIAFREGSLEQKVVERVVLHMDREALHRRIFTWPLRDRP